MVRLIVALVVVVGIGCERINTKFCLNPDNAGDPVCRDGAPDPCTSPGDCDSGVCRLGDGVCVACLENADCTDPTLPICNSSNQCVGCKVHSDCDSRACLPSGACAAEADVAYVIKNGGGATCSKDDPCGHLNDAIALGRATIKIEGTAAISDMVASVIQDATVTILADPNAKIARSTSGSVLEVRGSANVTIYDLEITGGGDQTGHGIDQSGGTLTLDHAIIQDNEGIGIRVTQATRLVIRRCIFTANDEGGGDIQNVEVDITNTLFVANGGTTSEAGGLVMKPTGISVFQFNTIADNVSRSGNAATRGINCINNFAASENIVTNNNLSPACMMFDHSLFDATLTPLGTGNLSGDPKFTDVNPANLRGAGFYRINDDSAAVDGAADQGIATIDIDGEARPQGAGKDIGADETK